MGRPKGSTKLLTTAVQKEICDSLEIAVPFKHAVETAGIPERTAYEWMNLGEKGEPPYAEFFAAVTRAESAAVRNLTVKALQGGRGSHQAMFFLERRFRSHYGPTQKIEHSGPDGKAIEITAKAVSAMSDEELLRLAGNPTRSAPGISAPRDITPKG